MRPSLVKGFIITTFVSLYLVVSIISTIHVIDFFRLSNPNWLAVSLAIAFEIGAAASLASIIALDKMNKTLIWFLFIVLTAMQMMGNTYYAFTNLKDFQSWVELFGLVDEELIYQKRMLSIISGAILPLVALGFIKSLVDYIRPEDGKEVEATADKEDAKTEPSGEDLADVEKRVWEKVAELKKEGKLPEPTAEEIADEPTALANSQYREDEIYSEENLQEMKEWETASLEDLAVLEAEETQGEETVQEQIPSEEINNTEENLDEKKKL